MPDRETLKQYRSLPMDAKVAMSYQRIREWYDYWNGNVFVSFSGGKDSTVLAYLVHEFYPDVPLVFVNTGLEFPEIQSFARKMGAEFLRPKMRFDEVISTYGYPIISKENSETIYYARRILNIHGGGQGRRQERITEERTSRTPPQERILLYRGAETTAKRAELRTTRLTREPNSWGGVSGQSQEGNKLRDKSDRATETTGIHRGQKSRGRGEAGVTKTLFDKRKWLPLCQETNFKISHMCCHVMKKSPMKTYQTAHSHARPYIGMLTEESLLREQAWMRSGCNAYESTNKTSNPMAFWTEQDVLRYIKENGLEIASVYGDIVPCDEDGMQYESLLGGLCGKLRCTGCQRTGCVFCGFGAHNEKGETRFQRLAKTHPRQYEYCMNGGQWVDNPDYDPAAPKMDGDWVNWNPKKIWVPSKEGLGMKKVFDDCNEIYGKYFIRYE